MDLLPYLKEIRMKWDKVEDAARFPLSHGESFSVAGVTPCSAECINYKSLIRSLSLQPIPQP